MKKKIIPIAMLLCLLLPMISAAANDTISNSVPATPAKSTLIWVRESDIPASALKDLQRDSKIQKIESDIRNIGEYVSVGKEIGMAVDTSLGALAHHIDKISQTNVGKFTMFMVGWKIIGEDLTGYLLGILTFAVFISIFIWSWYKNFYERKVPSIIEIDQKKKWYQFRKKKVIEYQDFVKDPGEWDSDTWMNYGQASYFGHICALIAGVIIIFLSCF